MKLPACLGEILRRLISAWSLPLTLVFCAVQANAQAPAGEGVIVGRVSNADTGDLLQAAEVRVAGTAIATITDRTGTFRLTVPAGPQTLAVAYSGLDSAEIHVTVAAGQTVTESVRLQSSVYRLGAFTVKGTREGTAEAIQLQKTSPNPKRVVATDYFGNPALNPGDVLLRLPDVTGDVVGTQVRTVYIRGMDPSFTGLMVDGYKVASSAGTSANRTFQIEQYGTANLERIEVITAPTPDMDASAIAGYINLVRKKAFDLPGRRDSLLLGVLWKDRHEAAGSSPFKDRADNLDEIGFTHSDVYSVLGGSNNLGVTLDFLREVSTVGNDENGPNGLSFGSGDWTLAGGGPNYPLMNRWGSGESASVPEINQNLGLNVDYKLNDDAMLSLSFGGSTHLQYQHYYRWWVTAPQSAASFAPGSTTNDQIVLPGSSQANTFTGSLDKHSKNLQYGATYDTRLFDRTADLKIGAFSSFADIVYPNFIQFQGDDLGVGWELARNGNPWYPSFSQNAGASVYNANSYVPDNYSSKYFDAPDDHLIVKGDFQKDFSLPVPVYLKTGASMDDDRRKQKTYAHYYIWGGPPGSTIAPDAGPNYYSGDSHYGPYPFVAIPGTGRPDDITLSPNWTQGPAQAYSTVNDTLGSFASFEEKIYAGYVMGHVQLGDLGILGGVRFEQTQVTASSLERNNTNTGFDPTLSVADNVARAQLKYAGGYYTITGRYHKAFPGIHWVYEPWKSFQLRASYSTAITRQPVANLLPNLTVSQTGAGAVSIGNPNLKPFYANNYEVSAAKYFASGGVLSASVFLKDVSNYSANVLSTVGSGPNNGFGGLYAGYTLSTPTNLGSARFRGFDVDYSQQFTFLPGAFRGLGAFANYTNVGAVTGLGTPSSYTTVVAGVTPRIANAGVSYVSYGVQVRLLANYRGETPDNTSFTNPALQTYRVAWTKYDLKLQYTINRNLDVYLDIDNLTNQPYGTDVLGPLRWKYYSIKPGTSYDLSSKFRF